MKSRCPYCKSKLNIPDRYSGKEVKCPHCHKHFLADLEEKEGKPLADQSEEPPVSQAAYKEPPKRYAEGSVRSKGVWPTVKDFLLFRIFIFPWLIVALFGLSAISTPIVFILVAEDSRPEKETISPAPKNFDSIVPDGAVRRRSGIAFKWIIILAGLLLQRIVCEWLILFFRIYTRLGHIQTFLEATKFQPKHRELRSEAKKEAD